MNEYEITYLINPNVTEEARDELNAAVDKKIGELKGLITQSAPTLRRKLAYPVGKTNSAFLRALHIQLDPAHIHDVQSMLKKANGVLRVTILNTPYRKDLDAEFIEKVQIKSPNKKMKKVSQPQKEVTMEDVEKGIEEALTEEVK